ncbi:MAG: Stp1/IreP family PP2C-type Ser/Thr phosphatase [Candidatus Acidiferrum sp.]
MRIASGGKSDVGQQRGNNEDSFRIVEALELFVISDGMGGEAHGEIASAMAVETVVKTCLGEETAPPAGSASQAGWSEHTTALYNAVHFANKKIFDSAEAHIEQQGMGATITAAWINEEKVSVVHVGDSRLYLLRSGALQQLTSDHSLVAEQVRRGILTAAEAEHSEMQSVLLRALGTQPQVEVDADEHVLFPLDVLLLCSDGLTRMVTEPEIAGTLQAEPDPARAADRLVELANENGGADNVTVIVIRMESEEKGWFSWLRRGAQKNAGSGNGSAGGL